MRGKKITSLEELFLFSESMKKEYEIFIERLKKIESKLNIQKNMNILIEKLKIWLSINNKDKKELKIFWEKRYLYGIYDNENQIFNDRFKFNEANKYSKMNAQLNILLYKILNYEQICLMLIKIGFKAKIKNTSTTDRWKDSLLNCLTNQSNFQNILMTHNKFAINWKGGMEYLILRLFILLKIHVKIKFDFVYLSENYLIKYNEDLLTGLSLLSIVSTTGLIKSSDEIEYAYSNRYSNK
ncbi:hypothetical protein BpHYR1_005665 [Brachionus plicatilis]|uniref:Uncharacterized protein n=1 Tax=Brachionus plicatilis TaxID=10195 RepID=A0A3M7PZS6_BRAPC|nr:hypothetical protein BpHYR1_005665 [Brachionus plicatilis]